MLKRLINSITFTSILLLLGFLFSTQVHAQETMYFFYGTGCPHCSNVKKYFDEIEAEKYYNIESREIYFDKENAVLFLSMLDERNVGLDDRGVPALIAGDTVLIGDSPIIDNFEQTAVDFTKNGEVPIRTAPEVPQQQPNTSSNLTLVAVILASIVDAINPCAFAVLIILMSTVISGKNSLKALKSGLAFSLAIFISYLLMGLGLYKAFELTEQMTIFYTIIGWLAVVLGIFNLKDWLWYGKGFLMEVPLSWRPRLKKLIKSVTSPLSAFAIGFAVSLFLLPCTSGPYIVILGMLAQKTELGKAIFYLVLYNMIFVLPMILITFAVYKGFDPNKAEEARQKRLRTLHLIAGVIMIAMGIWILA